MRCGKCKSKSVTVDPDSSVEILYCRVCGWRCYGDGKSQYKDLDNRWQLFQELWSQVNKNKITDVDWFNMMIKKFEEFRKSRNNTAHQRIMIVDGAELPGQWNVTEEAKKWLPEDLSGIRFLDVRADMGGFCIEAAKRGAKKVIGLEASPAILRSAKMLCEFVVQLDPETNYGVIEYKPFGVDGLLDVDGDFVVCFSGVQTTRNPKWFLEKLVRMVRPGGVLLLELKNGEHQLVLGKNLPPRINCWEPTHEAMLESLKELHLNVEGSEQGRAFGRTLYRCRRGTRIATRKGKEVRPMQVKRLQVKRRVVKPRVSTAAKPVTLPIEPKTWPKGEPCDHPGCLNHVTHPCEGCGRIAGGTRIPKGNGGSAPSNPKKKKKLRLKKGWLLAKMKKKVQDERVNQG